MSCPEVRARLLVAERDELAPDREIGQHLAGCPGCAAQVLNIQIGTAAVAASLNGWSSNLEPARIMERIGRDQASARSRSEHWWGLMGTAAIVLISLMVYVAKSERTAIIRAGLGFPDLPYISSFTLRCLQPEAAAEIGRTILASTGGSAEPVVDGGRAVVLSGARRVVVSAEIAIKEADGSLDPKHPQACPIPSRNKR
jgi:anti-sigma factor RsiW